MPKLHLVAITPDNKGLVLSDQAESNRGDLILDIDDRLLDAIERAQRQAARDAGQKLESAALPSRRQAPEADGGTERLTPRQIQDRLRAGESVAAIAKSSGTDEDWVERFAPPVFAEIDMIVAKATKLTFVKPRVGPSGWPLGSSVAANVVERGATVTTEEIDGGWTASHRPGGTWIVTFSFPQRGRRQRAEWGVDVETGELTARNKLATELGYRESGRRPARPTAVAKTSAKAVPVLEAPEDLDLDLDAEVTVEAESGVDVASLGEPAAAGIVDAATLVAGAQTLPGTEPDPVAHPAAVAAPEAVPEAESAPDVVPALQPAPAVGEADPTVELSVRSQTDPSPPPSPSPSSSS